ncbi:DUF2207 family protein [Luteipulveratus flavus]|uniref:DUF2207 domain-containing protein n=1 Tax=Luteipulveratus flavus TaxID=3031728 RepID=A0ABT6CG43_9MICO|nr:DUF2207 domain-containing protein [Luteipulveratus sp. YIM 133296]MDF8266261.1 DUF2207 domain-containing protein [Luteipulveratus sp. YIM 133296]
MHTAATNEDIAYIVAGALLPLLAIVTVLWMRRRRRDEVYVGITPGLTPVEGAPAKVRRVRGGKEWSGATPVQFHPPKGVSPAIAGVLVDGSADPRDLGSLVVDLSVRGWFDIARVDDDWELRRRPQPPMDQRVTPTERAILAALFRAGPVQRMSTLKGDLGISLREAQIGLYREVVDRGWYRKHPRSRNALLGCLGLLVVVAAGFIALGLYTYSRRHVTEYWWALPSGVLLAGLVMALWGRGRTPRTADGTAVRVQTLGFRQYLATAEARQIRVEEAAGLFARYLPYAMVFGLADQWARVISQVLNHHRMVELMDATSGALLDPGAWMLVDGLADLAGSAFDISALADGVGGLGDTVAGSFGFLDGVTNGVDGLVSGVGDFVGSAGDLFDGLDGCDGCDALGCLDF